MQTPIIEAVSILEAMRGNVPNQENNITKLIGLLRGQLEHQPILTYHPSMIRKVGLLDSLTQEQEQDIVNTMREEAEEDFMWDVILLRLEENGKLTISDVLDHIQETTDKLLEEVIIDADDRTNIYAAYEYFDKYNWIWAHGDMRKDDILKNLECMIRLFKKYSQSLGGMVRMREFIQQIIK